MWSRPLFCWGMILAATAASAGAEKAIAEDNPALLEGPEPVVVGYVRADNPQKVLKEEAILCLLRDTVVWYRDAKTGKLVRQELRGEKMYVRWIEAPTRNLRWEWDDRKKEFKQVRGDRVVPEPINLAPLPDADKNREKAVFAAIEQLFKDFDRDQFRLMDDKEIEGRQEAAGAYRTVATTDEVKALCAGLLRLLAKRQERDRGIRNVVKQRNDGISRLVQQRKLAERELSARLREWTAWTQMAFLDDIDGSDLESLLFTGIVALGKMEARRQIQGQLFQLQADNQRQIDQKKFSDEVNRLHTDSLRRADALHKEFMETVKAEWEGLDVVGQRRFGRLDPRAAARDRELLRELYKTNDHEKIRQFCNNQLKREPDNPFLKVELCTAEALHLLQTGTGNKADDVKRAQEMLRLAREGVEAVRLVPPGRAYDRARLTLLARACILAARAADIELTGESWRDAYSPAAAYAVRLADAYEGHRGHFELTGLLRESRAWALAQSGRPEEGLKQALAVRELRQHNPQYAYKLARLYGSLRGADEKECLALRNKALEWVEHAITKTRFSDIKELQTTPDLADIRLHPRFKTLTRIVFTFHLQLDGTIAIINKSPFPLTNVHLHVQVIDGTGKKPVIRSKVPVSLVGPEQMAWFDKVLAGVGFVRILDVRVLADQQP